MLKKISHFIQYHNFFSLGITLVFAGASASFAASPELRAEVVAQNEVVRSADNTYVINTNFDDYDMGLKIQSVTEDGDKYYIDYIYNTVESVDYVWKQVPKTGSMKVSKKELEGRDLGLYVADQLGQIIDQQISYLKEFQKEQKSEGETRKVVAIEYSGLVGRFLETNEKVFEGYQPVIPPSEVASNQSANSNVAAVVMSASGALSTPPASLLTREEVQGLIRDTVRQLLLQSQQPVATTTPMVTPSSAATTTPPTPTSPKTPDAVSTPAPVIKTVETKPAPPVQEAASTTEPVVVPKVSPPAPVPTPDPIIKTVEMKPAPPAPLVIPETPAPKPEPPPAPPAPVIVPTPVLPPVTAVTPVMSTPPDPVPVPTPTAAALATPAPAPSPA